MAGKGFDIVNRRQWGARSPRQVTSRTNGTVTELYVHWPGDPGILRQDGDEKWLKCPEDEPHGCILPDELVARAGRINTPAEEKGYTRGVQNFHMDVRGWNDIAYNYLVFKSGRIYSGRTFKVVPASQAPFNTHGVSICAILGTGDTTIPPQMRESLREFVRWCEKYAGHGLKVRGHKDVNQTSCPGPTLYAYVDNLDRI